MALQYTVDENNVVKIFDQQKEGSFSQPHWPNGDEWANKKEAEDWAKLFIESMENENALHAPSERNKLGKKKITESQIELLENIRKAETEEEKKAAEELFLNTLGE